MNNNKPLIELTDVDRRFYEERLSGFLPEKIIDIHTHIWRKQDYPDASGDNTDKRIVSWPSLVAEDNPVEDLIETYRILFPDKQVTPLVFGTNPKGGNLTKVNNYAQTAAISNDLPALIYSDPAWSATELEHKIKAGGFIGAKSYLTMSPEYIPTKEIRIFDFFPQHQLAVHEKNGWTVMLHIPRDGRLKDAVNLNQMLQIDRDYPRLKIVIAHVGRAYCDEDIGNSFDILSETKNLCFDISANTNDYVFEQLVKCVGPKRVLFGSDMPISRMRMRRITRDGHYVNLVPPGLYGDITGDPNMDEVDESEAKKLTFFIYEEIDAFRRAAERLRLSKSDVEDVFYKNAKRLIGSDI